MNSSESSYIERVRNIRSAEWIVLKKVLADFNLGQMLEVGSRDAFMARKYLALGWNVIGIDIRPSPTDPGDPPILQGDAHALPFGDNSFDCVIFAHCFLVLDDPIKAISESYRVLKKGGTLIILTATRFCLLMRIVLHCAAFIKKCIATRCLPKNSGVLPAPHNSRFLSAIDEIRQYRISYIYKVLCENGFKISKFIPTFIFIPPDFRFQIKPRKILGIASSCIIIAQKD